MVIVSRVSARQRAMSARAGTKSGWSRLPTARESSMWCPHSRGLRLAGTLLVCAAIGASQSTTVNVQVSNQINSSAGVNGRLQVAMSTSFQLASGSYQFFSQTPQALATLGALQPQHTRVQVVPASDPLSESGRLGFLPARRAARAHPEFRRPQSGISNRRRSRLHERFERLPSPGELSETSPA